MQITKEIVRKTAHLARLEFSNEEENAIMKDLQKMVDWVDKLKEVGTEGIEPLTNMSTEANQFREDVVTTDHMTTKAALKNAPKEDGEFFRVPKVIK